MGSLHCGGVRCCGVGSCRVGYTAGQSRQVKGVSVFRPDQIVPLLLTCGMAVSAVVCACCRRWWDALYWLGGALLNAAVIFRG